MFTVYVFYHIRNYYVIIEKYSVVATPCSTGYKLTLYFHSRYSYSFSFYYKKNIDYSVRDACTMNINKASIVLSLFCSIA